MGPGRADRSGGRSALGAVAALLLLASGGEGAADDGAQVLLRGNDFTGGAKDRFGELKHGERVNYVYAQASGKTATMEAAFGASPTTGPLYLHVRGRDDDGPATCTVRISLNDRVLFEGKNTFASGRWETRRFEIPLGVLRTTNTLTIRNTETEGKAGMPPWFMVASCAVGGESASLRPDVTRDFRVDLPGEKRPFPEPLADGEKPGFAWRGTKGWLWTPDQYLETIPHLPRCGMNFLMNCYGSMCDIENVPWGDPRCNRWYEPLPEAKKRAYEKVVEEARRHGLTFCFSMNPNLSSSRYVKPDSPEDIEALWQHYSWMQGLGVKWFNISLDDITQGIDAERQARVVNEILARLRARDPEARMIFCPTWYWGEGTDEKARPYLETLSKVLDPDVYLFWTGSGVVGPVTRKSAEIYKSVAGRRLFLWDNYPVNDGHPTMHLGPVMHRDRDLGEVIDGYMANPLATQTRANLLPMYTCGDYAWNPRAYDPERSIGQALLHLEQSATGRELLKDLVEIYPGMLVDGTGRTNANAARDQYVRLVTAPHSRAVGEIYVRGLESLAERFEKHFAGHAWAPEVRTLRNDIQWMREDLKNRYAAE